MFLYFRQITIQNVNSFVYSVLYIVNTVVIVMTYNIDGHGCAMTVLQYI